MDSRSRIWDDFLTERDKHVFEVAGWGTPAGYGRRPALLVIDVCYGFTGDKPEPILNSIQRWSNSCGEEAWRAVRTIALLLQAAHAKDLPVIYTTGRYRKDYWDRGLLRGKNARVGEWSTGEPGMVDPMTIVNEIAPGPRDLVVYKQRPSAFFGTPLLSHLIQLGVDSVIVGGTTTSGCVRATVVDAFSHNLRVVVAEDACFDRCQASHALSLFDMNAKYADVVSSGEILEYIAELPGGQFVLPNGLP